MKKASKRISLLFCGMIVGLFICVWPSMGITSEKQNAQKVIKWKMQSCWPPGLIFHQEDKRFVELVKNMSGGRLDIELFTNGALCGCFEVFETVKNGSIEIGSDWTLYWEGYNSAFMAFGSTPSFFTTQDYFNWYFQGGGKELINKLYDKFGLHFLPRACLGPETGLWSNTPYRTADDYKGQKIRISGKIQGAVLKDLGGIPVALAGSETYEALRRGTLDATEFSLPVADVTFGYHEISKYVSGPSWWQSACMINYTVNKKAWDELPDDLKEIVEQAAVANALYFTTFYEYKNIEAMKKIKDAGVEIVSMDAESIDKIQRLIRKYTKEEAAKNPDFAAVINSMERYAVEMIPVRDFSEPWSHGETPKWLYEEQKNK